jgi:cleavage and polyadenylation specificity factor subunit 5
MKLLAVPLFELYDNTARYGPQLSAIPHYLSKYRFEFVDEDGNLSSVMPGDGEMPGPKTKVLVRQEEGKEMEGKGESNGDGDAQVKMENGL